MRVEACTPNGRWMSSAISRIRVGSSPAREPSHTGGTGGCGHRAALRPRSSKDRGTRGRDLGRGPGSSFMAAASRRAEASMTDEIERYPRHSRPGHYLQGR